MALKRFALCCVVTCLLGTYPSIAHASSRDPFKDVSSNHPFYPSVMWAYNNGVLQGYPDGKFRPDSPVNRAEFLKVVIRSQDPGCKETYFGDVPKSSWYETYVCQAVRRRWVEGYSDGTFRPSSDITFAEASKIVSLWDTYIYRTDIDELPRSLKPLWYWPYVKYLADNQAYPYTVPTFDSPLTRGELVDILHRLSLSKKGRQETPGREVSIAFYTEDELVNAEATASFVVSRPVGNYLRPANAALQMLFAGPSRQEVESGARTTESLMELLDDFIGVSLHEEYSTSWSGNYPAMEDVAVVRFRKPAEAILNGVAAIQLFVKSAIEETLKQFENVQTVLYEIDGIVAVGSDG